MKSVITVERTFDAGHRVVGHRGKCSRLHGHTYKAQVALEGMIRSPGFVADFGEIKEEIDVWDHRLLLWDQDNILGHGTPEGVLYVPFNPTVENMVDDLAKRLYRRFGVDYVSVELWETPTARAFKAVRGGI